MMSIYPIVRIQLSFAQFSLLCYEFCILSKTECKSIYYHFRRDHESSSFRKLARNKWICRETCGVFFVINKVTHVNIFFIRMKKQGNQSVCIILLLNKIPRKHFKMFYKFPDTANEFTKLFIL